MLWSTHTDPDQFEVCANCVDNSIYGETNYTLGSAREYLIRPDAIVDYGEGNVVAVYARKTNFLKSAPSAEGTSDVVLLVRSPDVRLFIRH
jgi:hypothetical protein